MTPLSLTPEQQAAVAADDGAYLLVAPPGSGKTEILVRRIGRLLEESAGQTFRVLALTFTNRAAEDIQNRISADIAGEQWRLFAGTFHSFCLEMLRSHGEPVGVRPDVTVYADLDERVELLEQSLVDEGFNPGALGLSQQTLTSSLQRIDELRGRLVAPESAPPERIGGSELPLGLVYAAYERALDQTGGLDYPAMLTRAYRLLSEHAWTGNLYRRLFRYILIDEAQDSSRVQVELIDVLCGDRHRNVFVVADRNQSIYRFAGADPERLLGRFKAKFDPQELPLTSNFRSASTGVPQLSAGCRRARGC